MIKGLYEAHLPVRDLKISIPFYQKLNLEMTKTYQEGDKVAFFWIEKGKSWIGLWENQEAAETKYHPSLRHIAFEVSLEDLKKAKDWLQELEIELREDFGIKPTEPIVMPRNSHTMVYFNDPDGNSLELIAYLHKEPENLEIMYLSDWEKLQS